MHEIPWYFCKDSCFLFRSIYIEETFHKNNFKGVSKTVRGWEERSSVEIAGREEGGSGLADGRCILYKLETCQVLIIYIELSNASHYNYKTPIVYRTKSDVTEKPC